MRRLIASVCFGLFALSLTLQPLGMRDAAAQEKAAEAAIVPEEAKLGRPVDFEKDVFPILDAKCIACHNVAITENGLNLEDVAGILKGGKRGPAVVAKDLDKSPLFKLAARGVPASMPPLPNKVEAAAVTPKELGIIKQWILEGAAAGEGMMSKSIDWHPLPAGVNPIYAVSVTHDGQYVACGRANKVVVYHIPTGDLVAELADPALASIVYNGKPMYQQGSTHRDYVHSLAFSDDGRTLASGSFREVKLWTRPDAALGFTLPASTGPVAALALSADDKWLATAAADFSIKLWNMADGQPGKTITGHTAAVTGLKFSPDGTKLISSSQDKTVRVWNLADGAAAGQVEAPAALTSLATNLDATKVIVGAADNQLYVFDTPTPATAAGTMPTLVIKGHTGPVNCVTLVLPPGTQVASGSEDGTVKVWDLASGNAVKSMAHGAPVTSVACRPDGQFLASASANNTAKLWNAGNGQQVAELKGDNRAIKLVAKLTLDDTEAAANLAAATAAVAPAEKAVTEKNEAVTKATEAKTKAEAAFNDLAAKAKTAADAYAVAKKAAEDKKDDAALQKAAADAMKASTDAEAAAKKAESEKNSAVAALTQAEKSAKEAVDAVATAKALVETNTAKQAAAKTALAEGQMKATGQEKPFRAVAFSRDNKELAVAGDLGAVSTFDATTGAPFEVFDAHTGPVLTATYGAARTLLTGSADMTAKSWNVNPGWSLVGVLGPKKETPTELKDSIFVDRVLCVDFNFDGSLLATGGGDPSRSGEVMIWDVKTQAPQKTIADAHSDTVFGIEFSRYGDQLLTGAADKFVKIFDVATGNKLKSFEGHTNHVLDVTWKADSKLVASAGADNAIKIWNVETGEQQRTIAGFTKQVTSIQFMGRGQNMASCSGDKTVRFHQADNGNNFRNFAGSTDFMYAAAASDDEKVVAAGGQDGALRVWNGTNGQVLRTFEAPKPPVQVTAK